MTSADLVTYRITSLTALCCVSPWALSMALSPPAKSASRVGPNFVAPGTLVVSFRVSSLFHGCVCIDLLPLRLFQARTGFSREAVCFSSV